MSFIRRQEERLAIRLLQWKYKRVNQPLPVFSELQQHAVKIVDEAHRIASERGRNVIVIIKELANDLKK
ncbi:MAG: hypothetical protein JW786_10575 [Desulfobacterales bacterium]|nr:hypothetical protein [Desulfobacterales bacterium]